MFCTLRPVKWFRLGLMGLLLGLLLSAFLALQRAPSLPPAPALRDARLAWQAQELLRSLRPRQPGQARQTLVGEPELNWLLAQAAQAQGWRAQARIGSEQLLLQAALPAPGLPAWLNWQLSWDLRESQSGRLPRLSRVRLGHLPLPAAWVEPWLLREVETRLPLNALLPLLDGWHAAPGWLRLDWRWRPEQAPALLARLWTPADRDALLLQARLAQAAPATLTLAPLLQARAAAALQGGQEPAAALRALLVVSSLQVLGRDLAPWLPEARRFGRLPALPLQLAAREDMAMHFLVSALLAWQGGERAAAVLGLAKELADRRGGSGFSFNDLAADAAGSRFGRLAAADPAALLRRLAAGLPEPAFFPAVADLPEYLSEQAFRERYGDVGSPAYAAELARLQARIDALPLYQGKNGS